MSEQSLRILVFGAHPDDCDATAGGVAVMYARRGHAVRFVALTNGNAGHHEIGGVELARRRLAEAQASGRIAGVEYLVMNNNDGALEATLANRWLVIGQMREFRPDLVLTHRSNDYHPDHRTTGILVQDAAYCVTVPNILPLVPHLRRNPVIAYVGDRFRKPAPFQPDVVVAIDEAMETKWDMMHCHQSQFYEWIPYNMGILEQIPTGDAERRKWMRTWFDWDAAAADRYREQLIARYGPERGRQVRYAEAFEVSEYGSPLSPEAARRLFPF